MPVVEDAGLQSIAGVSLLKTSKLVRWTVDTGFTAVEFVDFEEACAEVDPSFGRLTCWILFSAGFEFLAKGVCLANGIEVRRESSVPEIPDDAEAWLRGFDPKKIREVTTTHFGTLGSLVRKQHLDALCNKVGASPRETAVVLGSCELLGRAIRNRDAHAYVRNVRAGHHHLVGALLCECLNVLVSWLPDGRSTVALWQRSL